ncbi:MAG: alpha/beta hydrolase fold domain-containing protein [Thermoguttaceae bacterium]
MSLEKDELTLQPENQGKTRSSWRRRIGRFILWSFLFCAFTGTCLAAVGGYFFNKGMKNGGFVEDWTEGEDGAILKDVSYGSKSWQVMDVYLPKEVEPAKSKGAFVFIHGGAWMGGTRRECAAFAKRAAKSGYLAANIEYMLYNDKDESIKKEYSLAKVMEEIDAAISKLTEVGSENGYQVKRVALSGHSAGGHLTMQYGYTFKERTGIPDVEIAFLAPRVGPADFHAKSWKAQEDPKGIAWIASFLSGRKITGEELAEPDAETEIAIESISPVAHIKEDAPPTLAAYGGRDFLVPTTQRDALQDAFSKLGAKSFESQNENGESALVFDLVFYENSGHMLENDPECSKRWQELLDKYAERYLTEKATEEK